MMEKTLMKSASTDCRIMLAGEDQNGRWGTGERTATSGRMSRFGTLK